MYNFFLSAMSVYINSLKFHTNSYTLNTHTVQKLYNSTCSPKQNGNWPEFTTSGEEEATVNSVNTIKSLCNSENVSFAGHSLKGMY